MARGGDQEGGGGGSKSAQQFRESGNSAFMKRDWRGAIESYDRALQALGAEGGAGAMGDGGKREEAVKCLTNRAMAHYKLEDYARCAADCSAALALDPGHGKARCVGGSGMAVWEGRTEPCTCRLNRHSINWRRQPSPTIHDG